MPQGKRPRSTALDRAADTYDQTHTFPPGVPERVASSLLARRRLAGPLLEVGVGTGRIAKPLAAQGERVVGIDLSRKMMIHLRETPSAPGPLPDLVEGDACLLPFPPGSFALVVSVHVLHLLADVQLALAESVRVLRQGGQVAVGWTWHPPDSPSAQIHGQWRRNGRAKGLDMRRVGLGDLDAATAFFRLRAQGFE